MLLRNFLSYFLSIEYNYKNVYDAVNNCRLKHIFCIICSIFPRNRRSCLDMLSEIVFVKCKLNAIGYQEMLLDIYRQLLHFITEIEDKKKTSFQQDNALIHTAAKYKNVVSK